MRSSTVPRLAAPRWYSLLDFLILFASFSIRRFLTISSSDSLTQFVSSVIVIEIWGVRKI